MDKIVTETIKFANDKLPKPSEKNYWKSAVSKVPDLMAYIFTIWMLKNA